MMKGMKLMIHISVCDNEAAVREDIAGILNNCSKNIEITQFSTGEELLEAKNIFHIHIIDIELDNMSGIDVAKQIRLREKNKRSKSIIIFVTGFREYMEDAFDVNAFHYLVKPIDEKKMSTVFKHALKEVFVRYKQEKQYVIVRYNGMQKK
ncbi:MAG: response regulator, partial [Lachnospiraceae bacterium]|nr:response regulator [Lachnospiraceae bacterium]